jgi:hypothetical protein
MEANMFRNRLSAIVGSTLLVLAAVPARAVVTAHNTQSPEDFTGILVNMAGGSSVSLTLHVDSFTTPGQVGSLSRLLGDKGQDAVVSALRHMKPRGWIRVGKMLGYEVPIIRSFTTDKGETIVAVLDRPIPIWEQLRSTRSLDYPFGMIEFTLKPDGNGNGQLIAATRAMFTNDGKIELESYGSKPYHIIGVTEQPATK